MPSNTPFDGVGVTLQLVYIFPEIFKGMASGRKMTFHGLLKSPGTFFDLFGMLLEAFKR
jgi:hypothetical protein